MFANPQEIGVIVTAVQRFSREVVGKLSQIQTSVANCVSHQLHTNTLATQAIGHKEIIILEEDFAHTSMIIPKRIEAKPARPVQSQTKTLGNVKFFFSLVLMIF